MSPYFTAILVAVVSPAILAIISNYLAGRQRAADKKLDWAREDEVARTAAGAAKLLLAANERVAEDTAEVKGQLHKIHTLVNSNLTAAMKARLEATMAKLVVMKRLASRDEDVGVKISRKDQADIDSTEKEINELTAELADRVKQTNISEQE